MKRRVAVALLSLSLFGFVCGDRCPVVLNELDRPIGVRITYTDGTSKSGELPVKGTLFLADPPRYPNEVIISVPTGATYTFTRSNSSEFLSGTVGAGPIVGWKVTDAGVLPLTKQELK